MDSRPPVLETLLARLASSGAEFVLVGALAAVAQGAPLTTFDVRCFPPPRYSGTGRAPSRRPGTRSKGLRLRVRSTESVAMQVAATR